MSSSEAFNPASPSLLVLVHKMAASGDAIAASALASSGATIALLTKQFREGSVEEQTAVARSLRILCAHVASRATIVGDRIGARVRGAQRSGGRSA
jgi:hypothetical protein